MKKLSYFKIGVSIAALCLTFQAVRADVVYDNSTGDLATRFNPGTIEVGDQISLAGSYRYVTNFTFEYFATNISLSLDARIRFYANDGAIVDGLASPGSLLFDSDFFNLSGLGNTERATLVFDLTGTPILVPDIFTWTIQFTNIATGGGAGLDIFSPPTVGGNSSQYWEFDGVNWLSKTNAIVSMDFAARVSATPEPSSMALIALGSLAICAFRRRK
jgi:hypothetical protein